LAANSTCLNCCAEPMSGLEASSFPNWNGADQKRGFAIAGDQLTLTARALQTGGHADVIWSRAK
jgi:hypothetical protein